VQDEAFLLLQAGSETTGQALSVAFFYILRDQGILNRIRKELMELMPDISSRPTLAELQSLPYFVSNPIPVDFHVFP
jgi:cytochrome P450